MKMVAMKNSAGICMMIVLFVTSTALHVIASENVYEQPQSYKASTLLKAKMLQRKHYKVDEQVDHDGFFTYGASAQKQEDGRYCCRDSSR